MHGNRESRSETQGILKRMSAQGCETCKWSSFGYCNRPGGNDCNWGPPTGMKGQAKSLPFFVSSGIGKS